MAEVREAHYTIKSLTETVKSSEETANSLIQGYLKKHILPHAESLGYKIWREDKASLKNPMYSVTIMKRDGTVTEQMLGRLYIRVMIGSKHEEPEITLSTSKDSFGRLFETLNIDDPENSFKEWIAKVDE
jgi:hypothetical protein